MIDNPPKKSAEIKHVIDITMLPDISSPIRKQRQDASGILQIKKKEAILEAAQQDIEVKKIILDGAEAFTREVLEQYPQINNEGKLNYYLSGSLGVMLLLRARKFEVIDDTKLPEIVPIGEKELSPEAVKYLEGFVRKIGDLDFVPLEEWKKSDKRMNKGGGGPAVADLSKTAKKSLEIEQNQLKIMCDPLQSVKPDRVARLNINGIEIYIPEPRMMFAYKVLHIGESFENANKKDKFMSDFSSMLKGMEAIYSREELLQVSHEIMFDYSPNSPNDSFVPYHNSNFSDEFKKFYDEMLALDPDIEYIEDLQYGKERSIGVLKVLHQYQSLEAKQAIINFFNQHKEFIDKWSINSSLHNTEILADFLLSDREILDKFKPYIKGEATREIIIEVLKSNAWAFEKYGRQISDKDSVKMSPQKSTVMDILMKINEENIDKELYDIGYLLNYGMDEFLINGILGAQFMAIPKNRKQVLEGLKIAQRTLDDKEFQKFNTVLYQAISNESYYNTSLNKFIEITEEERPEKIASVFQQFGLEYERISFF